MDTKAAVLDSVPAQAAGRGEVSEGPEMQEKPSKETRAEMLGRHQREIKDLQNKEIALKKAAAKGSKAEQKAKKKQAEEDIAKIDMKMRARHAKELESLGFSSDDGKESNGLERLVKAIAGISTLGGNKSQRSSKGQKWRERRAQQEAQREQRIEEEQNSVVSERTIENDHLEQKLHPLGLVLKEIKPDGHCLYRAVGDQLSLYPDLCPQLSYQQLREMAAAYMRSHVEDFMPFIGAENGDTVQTRGNLDAAFQKYCEEVESTATWGGQLELGALAHSLRKHIIVFCGDSPNVEMGKEYECDTFEDGLASNPSLRLSYHRYAFGLGEHYNSVVPAQPLPED
eukprot:c26711_g1_i1 orf=295-1317(-)